MQDKTLKMKVRNPNNAIKEKVIAEMNENFKEIENRLENNVGNITEHDKRSRSNTITKTY